MTGAKQQTQAPLRCSVRIVGVGVLLIAGLAWQVLPAEAARPWSAPMAAAGDVSAQQTLINQDRAQATLSALQWSSCLAAVAVQNAERVMAQGYLSHTNGATLDLNCGLGSTQGGENLAYFSWGIDDPQANTAFMNSPPHRANILGPYAYVATAWAVAPNGWGFIAEEFLGATGTIAPAGYQALAPSRILDTRTGVGGVPAQPLGPGGILTVTVAGRGGVPSSGVGAVVINVTVTGTTAPSYLTVFPKEDPRPTASNLNWIAGQTRANLVQLALRGSGQLSIYNAAGWSDVIFDVAGYVPLVSGAVGPAGLFHPLAPARILDTRDGTGGSIGPLAGGSTLLLPVAGHAGVPATGASAVVLNVTVTGATAASYLTVFPAGGAAPLASNLNFVAGQTVPNRVIVKLGAGGAIEFLNAAGSVQVIADLNGWFSDASPGGTGSVFTGVTPARILDTRIGTGGFSAVGSTPIALSVAGWGGVPLTTSTSPVPPTAVVLNVTVTNPTAAGYLTVYPDGLPRSSTSDLNFVPGQTVPNLVVVQLGATGKIDIFNSAGQTDVIIDVLGWYG